MLYGYTGTPRSGKSYSAIKDFYLPTLIANVDNDEPTHIYTNINGILEDDCLFATAEYTGLSVTKILEQVHIVDSGWFLNIAEENPEHSLVIADEAHKFWCSREWKTFSQASRDWIAESGQHDTDIIWISQTASSVEKWIVTRTEFIFSALNLAFLGMPKRFALRQRDGLSKYSNMKPTYHKIDEKVYNCYSSYQVEHKLKRVTKTPSMFGLFFKLITFLFVALSCYIVFLIFSDDEPPKAQAESITQKIIQQPTEIINNFKMENDTYTNDIVQPTIDIYSTLYFAGAFYISSKKSVVFLEDEIGHQFKASKIKLLASSNIQGVILYNNKIYNVGDSFQIESEKLTNLKFKPKKQRSNPQRVMTTYNKPTYTPSNPIANNVWKASYMDRNKGQWIERELP